MKKNKTPLVLGISIILILICTLLPRQAGDGVHLKKLWSTRTDIYGVLTNDPIVPFRLGEKFGFVDINGQIQYTDTVILNVALGDSEFVNYGASDSVLYRSSYNGSILSTVENRDFPFYRGNRLFTIGYGRQSLLEVGSLNPGFYFPALVSDVAANEEMLLVGLLDQGVKMFDNDANLVFEHSIENSRVSAVYGVAISPDSKYLAIVVGLDEQVILVFKASDSGYSEVLRKPMVGDEFRRNVYMDFYEKDKLIVETDDLYLTFDFTTDIRSQYRKQGDIIEAGNVNGFFGIAEKRNDSYAIEFYSNSGEVFLSKEFIAPDVFIKFTDNIFLIGQNSMIAGFTIEGEE